MFLLCWTSQVRHDLKKEKKETATTSKSHNNEEKNKQKQPSTTRTFCACVHYVCWSRKEVKGDQTFGDNFNLSSLFPHEQSEERSDSAHLLDIYDIISRRLNSISFIFATCLWVTKFTPLEKSLMWRLSLSPRSILMAEPLHDAPVIPSHYTISPVTTCFTLNVPVQCLLVLHQLHYSRLTFLPIHNEMTAASVRSWKCVQSHRGEQQRSDFTVHVIEEG